MNITVIGMGYVGLVSATVFAAQGHRVCGVDVQESKIEQLCDGITPFYEPGLTELIQESRDRGTLTFTKDLRVALSVSEIVFICVGTPSLPDGKADLSYVMSAVESIVGLSEKSLIIVNKSTVPVGTGDFIAEKIRSHFPNLNKEYPIVSIPEFLREGRAIYDAFHPDRIVIGCESEDVLPILEELHSEMKAPLLTTNRRTAEMIKYASNAFLATKISFINEIAVLCEKLGADVTEVSSGMGYDSRIGNQFLNAGIGYGGSCFPKDTRALVQIAGSVDHDFKLLKSVIEVNQQQREKPLELLNTFLGTNDEVKVAVLGLTFKPETDDVREAVSLDLIPLLQDAGYDVVASDPEGIPKARELLLNSSLLGPTTHKGKLTFVEGYMDAITGADAVIILTEWSEYMTINWAEMAKRMNGKLVIDGRNMYDPKSFKDIDLAYLSIGRNPVNLALLNSTTGGAYLKQTSVLQLS